jgi:hypothetical protein
VNALCIYTEERTPFVKEETMPKGNGNNGVEVVAAGENTKREAEAAAANGSGDQRDDEGEEKERLWPEGECPESSPKRFPHQVSEYL